VKSGQRSVSASSGVPQKSNVSIKQATRSCFRPTTRSRRWSRMNGTEDLVIDGENGWFVESPDDIAASLRELSNDADLRERMGESARKSSADFGWAPMIESYKRLYHSLDR